MSTVETPVTHQTVARELVAQIQAMRASVEGLVYLPTTTVRRLTPAASVSDRFIQLVAVAVEEAPPLVGSSRLTPAAYREVIAYTLAYQLVIDELEKFLRGVRDMVLVHRSDVGQEALRMYSVAQNFNRQADRELLIPHLLAMREALGRGRPRNADVPILPPPEATTPPAAGNGNGNGNGANQVLRAG